MPADTLVCRDLDVAIDDLRLISALHLDVQAGEFVCVMGCNGAGKSTLVHTLAGLRDIAGGTIDLLQNGLSTLSRAEVARRVALLAQQHDDAFPSTVIETVLLGRHPHIGFWDWESADDRQIAANALASLDLSDLTDRDVSTLSGGERQRVALATVLAQQPALYLLDEPLNNLDPHHQLAVLKLFKSLSTDGAATIAILHDLNLVARFADKVLLLFGPGQHGQWLYGSLTDCMTADNLTRLYDTPIEQFKHEGRTLFVAS